MAQYSQVFDTADSLPPGHQTQRADSIFRFSSGSNPASQLTNCFVLKCESIYKIEHWVARFLSCSNRNITWYWMISVQWRRVFSGSARFEGRFLSYQKSERSVIPKKQNRVCGERERERAWEERKRGEECRKLQSVILRVSCSLIQGHRCLKLVIQCLHVHLLITHVMSLSVILLRKPSCSSTQ